MLKILLAVQLLGHIYAYPEIGFLAKLQSSITLSSAGWQKLTGWQTKVSGAKGFYEVASPMTNNQDVTIPVSGIYFVAVTVSLQNADTGRFRSALVRDERTDDNGVGLSSEIQDRQGSLHSLDFTGFINLRAGEIVSVYVYASTDTAWTIKSQGSFTFHFIGILGAYPGFMVNLRHDVSINNTNFQVLAPWTKTTNSKHFGSASGFSDTQGRIVTVCSGVFMIAANIILRGPAGTYTLAASVNGTQVTEASQVTKQTEVLTLNLAQAIKMSKGALVELKLRSNVSGGEVLTRSQWSMAYVGNVDATEREFAAHMTQSFSTQSTLFTKVPNYISNATHIGEYFQPSNLFLELDTNFLVGNEASLYYVMVILHLTGPATQVECLTAVSASENLASGNEGPFSQVTKLSGETTSVSFSGVMYVEKGQHINIFVKSPTGQSVTVLQSSFSSMIKMRYSMPSVSAKLSPRKSIISLGWIELNQNWITKGNGLYSFSSDFSTSTGRFTTSFTGIYQITANIIVDGVTANSVLSLTAAINGVINTRSGLHAVDSLPTAKTTLNLYGSIFVEAGSYVSLFISSTIGNQYFIATESSFSILYIGPSWAVPGFHAALSNDIPRQSADSFEVGGWTNQGLGVTSFDNFEKFNYTSGRYYPQETAIYLISVNILIENATNPTDANILAEVAIDGKKLFSNGLQEKRPTNQPGSNGWFTMSFTGVLRMEVGSYLSLHISSSVITSYTVAKETMFSVVRWGPTTTPPVYGFHSFSTSESNVRNSPNIWQGMKNSERQTKVLADNSILRGGFLLGAGYLTPESGDTYTIQEPGVYFISGSFLLSRATSGTYEMTMEIDGQQTPNVLYSSKTAVNNGEFVLNYAGSLYLLKGQRMKMIVRGPGSGYDILAGTSLSVIKLLLDEKDPGLSVNRRYQSTQFSGSQTITNFEVFPVPKLFVSNVGFRSPNGTYVTKTAGVYVTSVSISLSNSSSAGETAVSILRSSNAQPLIFGGGTVGGERTTVITRSVFLPENHQLYTQLSTAAGYFGSASVSWSLYLLQTRLKARGISGRLSAESRVMQSWTPVQNWLEDDASYPVNTTFSHNSYKVKSSGIHLITFMGRFRNVNAEVSHAIYINSTRVVQSLWSSATSSVISIPVSAALQLNTGDVISFQGRSSDSSAYATNDSTISVLDLTGTVPVSEGTFAYQPGPVTVVNSLTNPNVLTNWVSSGRPGAFLAVSNSQVNNGTFILVRAGFYQVNANLMVNNTGAASRVFFAYGVLNGEQDTPVNLHSKQTIDGTKSGTLSIASAIRLQRFTSFQLVIRADDNLSFQVMSESSFSIVLIDDSSGQRPCSDPVLSVQNLVPEYKRIQIEKTFTYTCNVIGLFPVAYQWSKNNTALVGQTSKQLHFNYTRISDSGQYKCTVTYADQSATTNIATLSVYDPTPSIVPTSSYSLNVEENKAPGLLLESLMVSAEKFSPGPALVRAVIADGDPGNEFKLSNTSRVAILLSTNKSLDYERQRFYILTITAINMEDQARNSTIKVNITIIDVNDVAPRFNETLIRKDVPEDIPIGTSVAQAIATDIEEGNNGRITYMLKGNSSYPYFEVNSTTGVVMVKSRLDREFRDEHVMVITANDPNFMAIAMIIINVTDVNDNPPTFKQVYYNISLLENTPTSTSILQLRATDIDLGDNAVIRYREISQSPRKHFSLDTTTGIISVSSSLDYENVTKYRLLFQAYDLGNVSLTSTRNVTVVIDLIDHNDNNPHFRSSLYSTTLPENTPVGTSVLLVVASDADGTLINSQLRFFIPNSVANSTFQIDSYGNISLRAALDYEMYPKYEFAVVAKDTGNISRETATNVVIDITDINDNRPVFDPLVYSVNVSEFRRPGAFILKLKAHDNDSTSITRLRYSLESGNIENTFGLTQEGNLYLMKQLDRETRDNYTLLASVSDGLLNASIQATIRIKVFDENDVIPRFTSDYYTASVMENVSIGYQVLQVAALDTDLGLNRQITFSIHRSSANPSSYMFDINNTTGMITVAKKLDYESKKFHYLAVIATDAGNVRLRSFVRVIINVTDVNDVVLVFSSNNYNTTVSESQPNNTFVVRVSARNQLTQDTSDIRYAISGGNSENTFSINEMTGEITLIARLDYEKKRIYNLTVTAWQASSPEIRINAIVFVHITDVNDNEPNFSQSYYRISVAENIPIGASVIQINATDADLGRLSGMVEFLEILNTTHFAINRTTGIVEVTGALDYELQKSYSLVVVVSDKGTPALTTFALLDIHVTDVNENPVFEVARYNISVSEKALVGMSVLRVTAVDRDSGVNSVLTYNISDQMTNNGTFYIDRNGDIILNASLDYETKREYKFTVMAQDSGMPKLSSTNTAVVTITVLDVNDIQPVFDLNRYEKRINEGVFNGAILTVHASDGDGTTSNNNTFYYIVPSADSGNFTMNNNTGEISSTMNFDREILDRYTFQVEARDTGHNTLTGRSLVVIYIIDVNDNAPVCQPRNYIVNVTENILVGRIFFSLTASDRDIGSNSRLNYRILSGNNLNKFSINEDNGDIMVRSSLLAQLMTTYDLVILISDNGVPSLNTTVNVTVNIYPDRSTLKFTTTRYVFRTKEGELVNPLGQVQATDQLANSSITYSMLGESSMNLTGLVTVDSSSGNVLLLQVVDFEERRQISFSVLAVNNRQQRTSAFVFIMVQDVNERPYFVNTSDGGYTFNVSEHLTVGHFLFKVIARDNDSATLDNGKLNYTLLFPSGMKQVFRIDRIGRITLNMPLDYETTQVYNFHVEVYDFGFPVLKSNASVTVHVIDYNDNHPKFDPIWPLNITIAENTPIGRLVGELRATDADSGTNGVFLFSAIRPEGFLTVNASTGEIFLARTFDYEKYQSFELIATVEDQGTPIRLRGNRIIRLTITNENDNAPIFTPKTYNITVSETAMIGTHITTVFASDADLEAFGKVENFTILNGNSNNTFSINSAGYILLSKKLNFLVTRSYTLTVQAYDGANNPRPATTPATVYIFVHDVGTLQPSFILDTYVITIRENNPTPTFIVNVTATTKETRTGPIVYSIISNNHTLPFSINNVTGEIRSLLSFDYERHRLYSFGVLATDKAISTTGSAHVFVRIVDVNDNTPIFTTNQTLFNISETHLLGAVIQQFRATDADDGLNGQIFFTATTGDGITSGKFAVNQNGTLILTGFLDRRIKSIYTVVVEATDRGTPPLSSNLTVFISVDDIFARTVRVEFPITNYTVYVNENVLVPRLLNATARLTSRYIKTSLIYELQGLASEINPFSINALTGEISLDKRLDYEKKETYSFMVKAKTNVHFTAHATVTVMVVDVNDNNPVFIPENYTVNITESAPVGSRVVQLLFKDNDTAMVNENYTFHIIKGDPSGIFSVDNHGLITVRQKINLERQGQTAYMKLSVRIVDGTFNTSTAEVNVYILDMNDEIPRFRSLIYRFSVSENSSLRTEIGKIGAYDFDVRSPNDLLEFRLVGSMLDFALVQQGLNASVIVNKSLDYEKKRNYELVCVVSDEGFPTLQSLAIIHINITDINDNLPVFEQLFYNNTVAERSSIGITVLKITATDADSGLYGQIKYELYDNSATFSIDPDGYILLRKHLDYETTRMYTLTVSAVDGGNRMATSNATVTIYVSNINDNQPSFNLLYYYFQVKESASVGTNIGNVTATDGDARDNHVIYSIVDSKDSGNFSISVNTGAIYLRDQLDYESTGVPHRYEFTVQANDTGSPSIYSRAIVYVQVMDVNDNKPQVIPSNAVVNISEHAEIGTITVVLNYLDRDSGVNGRITWRITDPTDTFVIDSNGVITLKRKLNYKVKSVYNITVSASDNGMPSLEGTGIVIINVIPVDVDRPLFLQKYYEVTYKESLPLNSILVRLNVTSTFPNQGNPFSFQILNHVDVPEFSIQNVTKEIILKSPGFNYERRKRYDFSVVVSNVNGYRDIATVIIHVLNVNEHAPFFPKQIYNITISELSFLGFTALHLVGNDNDTGLTGLSYAIVNGNEDNDFRLSHDSIVVNEAFQRSVYQFNVSVRDPGGLMGYATVIINIKPELAPQFGNETYITHVYENISINSLVLQVTAGSLTRGIIYSIENSEASSVFAINNMTGNITLRSPLNYDVKRQYIFPIMAVVTTPVVLSDAATVIVNVLDVNDLAPVFSKNNYSATISQLHPVRSRIITLRVTDRDINSGLNFSIVSGNINGHFGIDNKGGLYLVTPLTRSHVNFTLTVRVFDGVHSTFTTIYIKVILPDLCTSEFEKTLYRYNVSESKIVGGYLTSALRLRNVTSELARFDVSSSNEQGTWFVNGSGYLILLRALDYERLSLYRLEVSGTIRNKTAHTAVVIYVQDVNDEPPILTPRNYTVQLSERTPIGSDVITFNATDLDTPNLSYNISTGNTNSTFSVDTGGTIFLEKKLDFETIRNYTLTVDVSDKRSVSQAHVLVHVLDVREIVVCHVNN